MKQGSEEGSLQAPGRAGGGGGNVVGRLCQNCVRRWGGAALDGRGETGPLVLGWWVTHNSYSFVFLNFLNLQRKTVVVLTKLERKDCGPQEGKAWPPLPGSH